MPRPKCLRKIGRIPNCRFFKPAGIPARLLEITTLTLDELEALRITTEQLREDVTASGSDRWRAELVDGLTVNEARPKTNRGA